MAIAAQNQIKLTPGRVISHSATVATGVYLLPTDETLAHPAIEIRGDGVTVDFKHAVLEGTPQTTEPNERKGLGLLIDGKNVTVKNLVVRGYKVGIMARNCPGLKIIDCDLSYNWKQHLGSTLEREDESDWQSYHQNDKDEWLGYGAAIYLRGCDGIEVRGCKAQGGQCGLMMTQCNKGLIWNNDFSFLSGIGIGMYRSSHNRIMHNKIDWCVRGFSYGVYNRGQDSAGILIYEQSNDNVFAYNSVTHGGDGFFLWAGQHTMDTGEGGCNGNLLFGNDFSHAATNGIEATFSKNDFVNNLLLECWHGIWGGYSYETKVAANLFGYNSEAIAWEHGQHNLIAENQFWEDNAGVHIWASPNVDPTWGYAKNRDIRSTNWIIRHNAFNESYEYAIKVGQSSDIAIDENEFRHDGNSVVQEAQLSGLTMANNKVIPGKPLGPASSLNQGKPASVRDYLDRFRGTNWELPLVANREHTNLVMKGAGLSGRYDVTPLPGGHDPFLKRGTLRGWRYILVDEWGPYDFKRPILWPRGPAGDLTKPNSQPTYQFEIIGPPGEWKVVQKEGVESVTPDHGEMKPGTMILVTFPPAPASNVKLTLEYTGQATTDYRGIVTPAGKPVLFGYSKFFAPIDWTIHFYKWTKSTDPSDPHAVPDEAALQEILKGPPLKELHSDRLDFAGGSFDEVTGNDHFITTADGTFTVKPGDYALDLTTDDGARLWLDGQPLIMDAWHYQGPTLYSRSVHLGPGEHKIRVEHFQIDGYAALKVNLRPRP